MLKLTWTNSYVFMSCDPDLPTTCLAIHQCRCTLSVSESLLVVLEQCSCCCLLWDLGRYSEHDQNCRKSKLLFQLREQRNWTFKNANTLLDCQNRIGFYDLYFNCGVEFGLRKTLSPFVKAGNLTLDLIIFIAFTVDTYFNSLFSTLLWLLLSSKLKTSFAALKLS